MDALFCSWDYLLMGDLVIVDENIRLEHVYAGLHALMNEYGQVDILALAIFGLYYGILLC